jgi:beta-lactamase superfamily II metal-dependent hydrolase
VTQAPLRIRFYESGIGETVLIEFPDQRLGVIDAFPPARSGRDDILNIIAGRDVEFVCLTHPHEDHGRDLVKILKVARVNQFWHSLSPINLFVYHLEQYCAFPSPLQKLSTQQSSDWASFMIELLDEVASNSIEPVALSESHKPIDIGDVKIHFLAPSEKFVQGEQRRLTDALSKSSWTHVDPNDFSLVIAIEFGNFVFLLGSDAKKRCWPEALASFKKAGIPRAYALKLPHHGSLNAFDLRSAHQDPNPINCWNLCSPRFHAVLFAGTVMHPHPKVMQALMARDVHLLSLFDLDHNESEADPNPLRIRIEGARAVRRTPRRPKYSCITFEVSDKDKLSITCTPA